MHGQRAKQKFFFQFNCRSPAKIARGIVENCEIFQRNGSKTTWTGIVPAESIESASKFMPGLLNPRFTYPSAISFPSRWLRVALVIQPTSFPGAEGATSLIAGLSAALFSEVNPHNLLLVCPDILIREITSCPM